MKNGIAEAGLRSSFEEEGGSGYIGLIQVRAGREL